jgi:hypothetical protein
LYIDCSFLFRRGIFSITSCLVICHVLYQGKISRLLCAHIHKSRTHKRQNRGTSVFELSVVTILQMIACMLTAHRLCSFFNLIMLK